MTIKKLGDWGDFMINMIQYLEQNPALVTLLKEKKASLIDKNVSIEYEYFWY